MGKHIAIYRRLASGQLGAGGGFSEPGPPPQQEPEPPLMTTNPEEQGLLDWLLEGEFHGIPKVYLAGGAAVGTVLLLVMMSRK